MGFGGVVEEVDGEADAWLTGQTEVKGQRSGIHHLVKFINYLLHAVIQHTCWLPAGAAGGGERKGSVGGVGYQKEQQLEEEEED